MSENAYEPQITAAIRRIQHVLKMLTQEECHVTHFGATYIDPKHLAVWLCVQSDRECERLYSQIMHIRHQIQECFLAEKYPEAAVPFIGVQVASQETVSRDYAGNWWHFFK